MKFNSASASAWGQFLFWTNFAFWLHLVSAFYLKGYLKSLGADAAWFSSGYIQVLTFAAIPLLATAGIMIVWGLLIFTLMLAKNEISFGSLSKGNWLLRRWSIALIWVALFVIWVGAIASRLFDAIVALKFPINEDAATIQGWFFTSIVIVILSPIVIGLFFPISGHLFDQDSRRRKEHQLLERQLDLALLEVPESEIDSIRSTIKFQHDIKNKEIETRNKYWANASCKLAGWFLLTGSIASIAWLAGASTAISDLRDFEQESLSSTAPGDASTHIWLIYTDGHHSLTYENSKSEHGFFFNSPEEPHRLELRWPVNAKRFKTFEKLQRLSGLILEYAKVHNSLPATLDQLNRPAQSATQPDDKPMVDTWDRPIHFKVLDPFKMSFELRSAGQNGIWGDKDDVHFMHESSSPTVMPTTSPRSAP